MTPLLLVVIVLLLFILVAIVAPDVLRVVLGMTLMLVPLVIAAGLFFAFCTPR